LLKIKKIIYFGGHGSPLVLKWIEEKSHAYHNKCFISHRINLVRKTIKNKIEYSIYNIHNIIIWWNVKSYYYTRWQEVLKKLYIIIVCSLLFTRHNVGTYIVLAKLSIVQTFSLVHMESQSNHHEGIYIDCTLYCLPNYTLL